MTTTNTPAPTSSVAASALGLGKGSANSALLRELAEQKAAAKEAEKVARAAAKEAKKNKPATKNVGSAKVSAQIKKTTTHEGVEKEAKGAVSIYGLGAFPVTKYVQSILTELEFELSPEFRAALRRDAENASFRFGDEDVNGKALSEKGSARCLAEMERVIAVLEKLGDATKDIFAELAASKAALEVAKVD